MPFSKISPLIQPLPIRSPSCILIKSVLGIFASFPLNKYLVLARLIILNKFFKPTLFLAITVKWKGRANLIAFSLSARPSRAIVVLTFSLFN